MQKRKVIARLGTPIMQTARIKTQPSQEYHAFFPEGQTFTAEVDLIGLSEFREKKILGPDESLTARGQICLI